MATPFVRSYNPSRDFEDGLHVFFTTIDPGLDWEPVRTIGSHLWYRPYVSLTPSTCFVLDDGTGRVVGYCIGTEDTSLFAQRWRDEFTATVDPELVPRPDVQTGDALMDKEETREFRKSVFIADCSMLQAWPEVLEEYPAHMHIDVLPEFQRHGWGTILINAFSLAAKMLGANGIHLGMVRSNTNGKLFYEKIGFKVCPLVMDDGETGEQGVNGVVLHMVKSL